MFYLLFKEILSQKVNLLLLLNINFKKGMNIPGKVLRFTINDTFWPLVNCI